MRRRTYQILLGSFILSASNLIVYSLILGTLTDLELVSLILGLVGAVLLIPIAWLIDEENYIVDNSIIYSNKDIKNLQKFMEKMIKDKNDEDN